MCCVEVVIILSNHWPVNAIWTNAKPANTAINKAVSLSVAKLTRDPITAAMM